MIYWKEVYLLEGKEMFLVKEGKKRLQKQEDMAPQPGLEPGTNGLTVRYSTN